jgi:predicted RNA methylase
MPRTQRLSNEVLAILSTVHIENNVVFLTCGMLSADKAGRKLYLDVNAALEALGGKWNRKAKGHVFGEDPTDKIENAILTGEVTPPSKNGYFPTPKEIVDQLIDLADVTDGDVVLEPSAGRGNISSELVRRGAIVHACELLPDNRAALLSPCYPKIHLYDEPDFMKLQTGDRFDSVVMNPPFEKQQDIDHVLHAYKMLKPNGRLVSVMAAGITFRQDKKATGLRELIDRVGGEIIPLPEGAFKESGTMVNTVIVVLPKEE